MQAVFRSNYAFIGISLIIQLFGETVASSTAVLAAFIVPLFNILAVITLTVFGPIASVSKGEKSTSGKLLWGF